MNSEQLTSITAVMQNYDCRLYKRILCVSTIRGATAFVNAVKDGLEDAQVNTIHRAKHWSACNHYRPVKPETLSEQFRLSIIALEEEKKFLEKIN